VIIRPWMDFTFAAACLVSMVIAWVAFDGWAGGFLVGMNVTVVVWSTLDGLERWAERL
jgi:hypothetical protein